MLAMQSISHIICHAVCHISTLCLIHYMVLKLILITNAFLCASLNSDASDTDSCGMVAPHGFKKAAVV